MTDKHQTDKLATLLRSTREQRRLSVRRVAQLAGVDAATVLRLEQGLIATPKADKLRAIGRVLDLSDADLYAAAGWLAPAELPTLTPYLRTKYRELPEEAVAEIEAVFERLARDYKLDGPLNGEDERP